MNNQNLRKPQSTSEAREWGHNGGVKSGQVRRERKAVRDVLEIVLSTPITDSSILKDIKKNGIPLPDDSVPTYLDYITSGIIMRMAKHGQMSDLEKLMAILGETPTENTVTLDKAISILSSVESVID